MGVRRTGWRTLGRFAGILLLASTGLHASMFDVTVTSGSLAGTAGTLVFDFTDGDPNNGPNNAVTLTFPAATGGAASTVTDGDVNFSAPDMWIFDDSDPFGTNPRSLYVGFGLLPASLAFSFTTTDNWPPTGIVPDRFSFLMLNAELFPLFPTTDPDGFDALFAFDIDGSDIKGPFGPTSESGITGFSMDIEAAAAVPEPGSLALFVLGFGAMFARRRLG